MGSLEGCDCCEAPLACCSLGLAGDGSFSLVPGGERGFCSAVRAVAVPGLPAVAPLTWGPEEPRFPGATPCAGCGELQPQRGPCAADSEAGAGAARGAGRGAGAAAGGLPGTAPHPPGLGGRAKAGAIAGRGLWEALGLPWGRAQARGSSGFAIARARVRDAPVAREGQRRGGGGAGGLGLHRAELLLAQRGLRSRPEAQAGGDGATLLLEKAEEKRRGRRAQRLDVLQQVRAVRRGGLRPPHRASAPPENQGEAGSPTRLRAAPAPPLPALFRPFSRPTRVHPLPAVPPPRPARGCPLCPGSSPGPRRPFPRPGRPQEQADNWLHSGLMRTAPGRYTGQGADSWMDGSPAQGRGRSRPERDRRRQEAGTQPLRGHGRLHRHQTPRCPTALSGPSQPPKQLPRVFSDFSPRATPPSRPAMPVPHQKAEETLGRPWGTCLGGTGGHPL